MDSPRHWETCGLGEVQTPKPGHHDKSRFCGRLSHFPPCHLGHVAKASEAQFLFCRMGGFHLPLRPAVKTGPEPVCWAREKYVPHHPLLRHPQEARGQVWALQRDGQRVSPPAGITTPSPPPLNLHDSGLSAGGTTRCSGPWPWDRHTQGLGSWEVPTCRRNTGGLGATMGHWAWPGEGVGRVGKTSWRRNHHKGGQARRTG